MCPSRQRHVDAVVDEDPRATAARERYEKAGTFDYGDGNSFGFVQVDPAARTARVSFVDGDGKAMHTVECTA